MAKVSKELFITIELALANAIATEWDRYISKKSESIIIAISNKKYDEAYDLIQTISFTEVIAHCMPAIKFHSMASFLFGALRASGGTVETLKVSDYTAQGLAITQLATILQLIAVPEIKEKASNVVSVSQGITQKTEIILPHVSGIKASVDGIGKDYSFLVSSLHTSRLSSYGFMAEAQARGIDRYIINEVLDGRVCPVCRVMHGKEFSVERAVEQLDTILTEQDPVTLKVLAPWPKQDKESVDKLRTLSSEEMQGMGLSLPPYHPFCRGLTGHKEELIGSEVLPVISDIGGVNSLIDLLFADLSSQLVMLGEVAVVNAEVSTLLFLSESASEFSTELKLSNPVGAIGAGELAKLSKISGTDLLAVNDMFVETAYNPRLLSVSGDPPATRPVGETVVVDSLGVVLSGKATVLYDLSASSKDVTLYMPADMYWGINKVKG